MIVRLLVVASLGAILAIALVDCGAPSVDSSPSAISSSAHRSAYYGSADIYVAENNRNTEPNGDISVYGPYNNTPIAQIAGSKTSICLPEGIAVGSQGKMYVFGINQPSCGYASGESDYILSFAAGANGNVAPATDIESQYLGTTLARSIAIGNDTLFVGGEADFLSEGYGAIYGFAPNANGAATPKQTITSNNLSWVFGMTLDAAKNLYAGDYIHGVFTFPATANGNVSPTTHLKPPTVYGGPQWFAFGVALDGQGSQCKTVAEGGWYTSGANKGDQYWANYTPRVMLWNGCPADGTKSPDEYVTSPGLKKPTGVAVDSAGNIYVADPVANAIFEYPAGATGSTTSIRTIYGGHPYGIAVSNTSY